MFYTIVENSVNIWGVFHDKKLAFQAFKRRVLEEYENFTDVLDEVQQRIDDANHRYLELNDREEESTIIMYDSEGNKIVYYKNMFRLSSHFDVVEEGAYVPFGPYAGYEPDIYDFKEYYLETEHFLSVPNFEIQEMEIDDFYYKPITTFKQLKTDLNILEKTMKGRFLPHIPQTDILYVIYNNGRVQSFEKGEQTTPLFDKYCGKYAGVSVRRFKGKVDKIVSEPFKRTGTFTEQEWVNACDRYRFEIFKKAQPNIPEEVVRDKIKPYIK